jgi:signal transduction histidine kinase
MKRLFSRYKFTFFQRPFISYLLVASLLLVIFGAGFASYANRLLYPYKTEELVSYSRFVGRLLQYEEAPSPTLMQNLAFWSERNISVIVMNRQGDPLEEKAGTMTPEARERTTLDELRNHLWPENNGETFRISQSSPSPLLVASNVVPSKFHNEDVVIFALSPAKEINAMNSAILQGFVYAIGAVLALLLLVVFRLSRGMSSAVRTIRQAAGSIAAGRYETRLGVTRTDELGDLEREFNRMASVLEQASGKQGMAETRRRQFLSDVTHELRTPLTSIRGIIEGLRHGKVSPDEEQKAYTIIEAETRRLIRLVNELTDIEKLETGQITLRPSACRVRDLFEIVAETLAIGAAEKNIRLHIDCPDGLTLYGDYDRLIQITMNVVKNAIQFSDFGTIRLIGSETPEAVILEIRDQGKGMSKEEQERMFERFYRGDPSRSKDKGASGLGLFIVRQLTEAHGGTADAVSKPGMGTTFRLSFPKPPAAYQARDSRTQAEGSSRSGGLSARDNW